MAKLARPIWPAYVLTLFVGGLGHCYLGQWKRGAAWFVLYILSLAFLSARTLSGALDLGEPFFVTALQIESVTYLDVAIPLAILVVCLLDVYLIGLAKRTGPTPATPEDSYSNGS